MSLPLRAVSRLFPELAVYRVNRILGASPDVVGWNGLVQSREQVLAQKPSAAAAARELYRTDLARLRRLEDKLQSHLSFMAPLIPIASATAAALYSTGRHRCVWWTIADLLIAALLIVHIAAGFVLARQGLSAIPLYLADRTTLEEAMTSTTDIEARIAATELIAMQYNETAGIRLNNAIAGSFVALAWVIVLLGIAAIALVLQLW